MKILSTSSVWKLTLFFLFLAAHMARAHEIVPPNASFETPVIQSVNPSIDFWQKAPQPPGFDTNVFQWDQLAGLFVNPPMTNEDHIVNADGNQLAYLFAYPQAALFQDYNSGDSSSPAPRHAFDAKFQAGKTYRLTAAITTSKEQPLNQGSTLQLSLYYRDAASNIVTVASTTITYDTNVFTDITRLLDFQVVVPTVRTNDPWADQYIGVQLQSTVAPNLIGGVWDIDNIRLSEEIGVPNFSFESPSTQSVGPAIDSWQKAPQPPNFDTNVFQWDQLAGLFVNPPSTNTDHIDNAEGNQLGYLFAYPGMALFQDSNSADSSGVASQAFNAKFEEGKSYRLTTAVTTSKEQPLSQGSILRLSLYYRDASNNKVTVASTNITYDTNVFLNITHLLDFSVDVPQVKASDPWAGQNIGIQIESPTPSLIGGVWDLDNVRLNELSGATLKNLTVKNSQVIFTVESEPGLNFEILGSNNIAAPTANWTILGVVHNDTGSSGFTEIGQLAPHRFYRAQQIP